MTSLYQQIFYKDQVEVTVDITENGSGLASLSYSLNGEEVVPVDVKTRSFHLPLGTAGAITVTAVDKAGNVSDQTLVTDSKGGSQWMLEDTPPDIGNFMITNGAKAGATGIYSSQVNVEIPVSDWDSGLNTITATFRAPDGTIKEDVYHPDDLQSAAGEALLQKVLEFEVSSQGSSQITIEARDNAGNQTVRSFQWILDTTKPQLICLDVTSPNGYVYDSWSGDAVTLTLKAGDGESGISSVSYSLDGGNTINQLDYEGYPQQIELPVSLPDGIYPAGSITFTIRDAAGNTMTAGTDDMIRQDTSAPSLTDITIKDYGVYSDKYGWYGGAEPVVGFYGKGADQMREGALTLYYSIYKEGDGLPEINEPGKWNVCPQELEKFNLTLPSMGQGAHEIAWYVQDEANNVSPVQTRIVRYDSRVPVFGNPSYTYETVNSGALAQAGNFMTAGNFFNEEIKIHIFVKDSESMLATDGVEYSLDQMTWKAADCRTINEEYSLTLPKGTTGQLFIRATDRMGNQSAVQVLGSRDGKEWYVEDSLPYISEIISERGNGEREWHNQDIRLHAVVKDEDSGLNLLTYRINGIEIESYDRTLPGDPEEKKWETQTTRDYSWNEVLDKEGRIIVELAAVDRAGNESTREAEFCLDKTKPHDVTMNVVNLPEGATEETYVSQDIIVQIEAVDTAADADTETSQIAGYRISLDGGKTWSEDYSWNTDRPEENTVIISRDGLYGSRTEQENGNSNRSILLQIWDYAGNQHQTTAEGSELLRVRRDTVPPPEAQFSLHSSKDTPELEDGWYNGPTAPVIDLTVEKEGPWEAVNHVYWNLLPDGAALPDEAAWTQDGTPVIPREGIWELRYYTEDEAGNRTATVHKTIRYDKTAPAYGSTPVTYGIVHDGILDQMGNFLTFGNFFKEEVRVYLSITDTLTDVDTGQEAASGISSLYYQITDESGVSTQPKEIPLDKLSFTLPLGTRGRIYISAVDCAGNYTPVMALEGSGDDNFWRVENNPPEIDGPRADRKPDKNGWYREDVTITVLSEDTGSGLNKASGWITDMYGVPHSLDGSITGEDAKTELVRPNYAATPSQAVPVVSYQWEDRLSMEGENMGFHFLAVDNARTEAKKEQTYNLDKTRPVLSHFKGVPDQLVNQEQTVTFHMEDSLSGIDRDSVRVMKDGGQAVPVTLHPIEGTRNYTGSITMKENGSYTFQVWDMAGNPSDIAAFQVDTIDLGQVEPAKVEIIPSVPDGENGWYVRRPEIRITESGHTGVADVNVYYTLWREDYVQGQPLSSPPEGLREIQYQQAQDDTWPVIDEDGIWHIHVWTKNTLNVVTECYEGVIYVDTKKPVNLTINSEPGFETNENPVVTVDADPQGTELKYWRYSTDSRKTWSQWIIWAEENQFVLDQDRKPSEKTSFEVKDLAGNVSASEEEVVVRDTKNPVLTPVLPAHLSTGTPVDTQLILKADKGMDLESAYGTISVYDSTTGSLYDTVNAQDNTRVSLSHEDRMVHVTLSKELKPGTSYCVEVSRGFVNDYSGNGNTEISGLGKWTFTTAGIQKEERIGFVTEVISGNEETSTRTRVAPVRLGEKEPYFGLMTVPAYRTQEGGRFVRLLITLNQDSRTAELTAGDPAVRVEQMQYGSFEVLIPAGTEQTVLCMTDGSRETALTIYQVDGEVTAEGDLNPHIQPEEVLGSLNLTHEVKDGAVQPFGIRLKVKRQKQLSGDTLALVRPYLPQDTQISPLDISLIKEKESSGGLYGEELRSLTQEIHITLDREQSASYCMVLRNHNGQITLIKPEINPLGDRLTFTTDRFSEYALLYSRVPFEDVEQALMDARKQLGQTSENKETASEPEVSEKQAAGPETIGPENHWVLLWVILVVSAVLSAYMVYKKKEKEKEKKDQDDEQDGQEMEEE